MAMASNAQMCHNNTLQAVMMGVDFREPTQFVVCFTLHVACMYAYIHVMLCHVYILKAVSKPCGTRQEAHGTWRMAPLTSPRTQLYILLQFAAGADSFVPVARHLLTSQTGAGPGSGAHPEISCNVFRWSCAALASFCAPPPPIPHTLHKCVQPRPPPQRQGSPMTHATRVISYLCGSSWVRPKGLALLPVGDLFNLQHACG